MRKKGYRHSELTKKKIAKSNTGKVFSAERRRNIGKSRKIIIPDGVLREIESLWKLQYIPASFIKKRYKIKERVYQRYKTKHCKHKQIKYLPTNLTIVEIEKIIKLCNDGIPYKIIAKKINRGNKQVRNIILKLGKIVNIKPLPKPRYVPSGKHLQKLSVTMTSYNIKNIKYGVKNGNWKGGISPLAQKIRSIKEYKIWKIAVLKRDDCECIICCSKEKIHIDHIYPFSLLLKDGNIKTVDQARKYKPLWNVKNGRALCEVCHKKTKTWGSKIRNYENNETKI